VSPPEGLLERHPPRECEPGNKDTQAQKEHPDGQHPVGEDAAIHDVGLIRPCRVDHDRDTIADLVLRREGPDLRCVGVLLPVDRVLVYRGREHPPMVAQLLGEIHHASLGGEPRRALLPRGYEVGVPKERNHPAADEKHQREQVRPDVSPPQECSQSRSLHHSTSVGNRLRRIWTATGCDSPACLP